MWAVLYIEKLNVIRHILPPYEERFFIIFIWGGV